jgi:hypothetical protein
LSNIADRFGTIYEVTSQPLGETAEYYVRANIGRDEPVARALVNILRCCVTNVLVYREADRRRDIASALYRLIEADLGRPLRPSRMRSKAGRAFWASRKSDVGKLSTEHSF